MTLTLLTSRQVAELLGYASTSSVYALIDKGELEAYRVGPIAHSRVRTW